MSFGPVKVGGNCNISVGGRPWESRCIWRKRALVKLVGGVVGLAVYLQEGRAVSHQCFRRET